MIRAAAGIWAPMHMDGLRGARAPSTSTARCVPLGLATRTPGTMEGRTQCWVPVCTHVSGWGGLVHGEKNSTPESMVDTHHAALYRVKYYAVSYFITASLPLIGLQSVAGILSTDTQILQWIRLSWHLFLIYFPCRGLFNTQAGSCVCVCLSS